MLMWLQSVLMGFRSFFSPLLPGAQPCLMMPVGHETHILAESRIPNYFHI